MLLSQRATNPIAKLAKVCDDSASTLHTSGVALCYSFTEYCCPVSTIAYHTTLIDTQLHSSMASPVELYVLYFTAKNLPVLHGSVPKKVVDNLFNMVSMFKMMQRIWSQGPGSMNMVWLGWFMMTCTGRLFFSECSTSLLWQPIVLFGNKLQCTSPTTVCQSPKFLVTSICNLPYVINCQSVSSPQHLLDLCIFYCWTNSLEFTAWSPTRYSCWLQTIQAEPENVSVRREFEALARYRCLRNRAPYIDIYLLTYFNSSPI